MPVRLDILGENGLDRHGGIVDEEWNWRLKGSRGTRFYQAMRDNDVTVGAAVLLIVSLLQQIHWGTEPGSGNNAAEAQEHLDSCLDDMSHSWADHLSEVLSMIWHGWSFFYVAYKIRRGPMHEDPRFNSKHDDNRWGWRKLAIRAQKTRERWEFDDDDGIRGMWQRQRDGKLVLIPMEQALLYRTETTLNNPEGRSLLRNAARNYRRKNALEDIEAVGAERDLSGVPWGTMPEEYLDPNASEQKKAVANAFARALKNLKNNEQAYLIHPAKEDANGKTGWDSGLMTTGSRRSLDTNQMINRYDKGIARSLLVQLTFLGMDGAGTQALGSELSSLLGLALGSIADKIEQTFNRFAVAPLMAMNGYAPEDHPSLKRGSIREEDLTAFTERMLRLVDANLLTPDSRLEDFIREKENLPERLDEDQDILDRPRKPTGRDPEPEPPESS